MKKYFTPDELRCKHCDMLLIDPEFEEKLNRARELAGFQFIVNSGYRCVDYNHLIGSTSTHHVEGKAADIKCVSDHKRFFVVRAMLDAGMLGIGIRNNFVHCDINRISPAIWVY